MYQVALNNEYFDSDDAEHTIPSTTPQGVRLRGLVIKLGVTAVWNAARYLDFTDDSEGDPILLRLFLQLGTSLAAESTAFPYIVRIPGRGIRFPNGIKFTPDSNYSDGISVMYEG